MNYEVFRFFVNFTSRFHMVKNTSYAYFILSTENEEWLIRLVCFILFLITLTISSMTYLMLFLLCL